MREKFSFRKKMMIEGYLFEPNGFYLFVQPPL
ncbi:Uncharacterised protein [Priestia megaterium]|nr:Uncharacterised protein [Priestia megaterium]